MSGRTELRQAQLISEQKVVPGTGTLTGITVSAPITGGGAGPVVPIGATQYDASHVGFVPSPGVHNHTKILWDDGWFAESPHASPFLITNPTPNDSAVSEAIWSATDTNAHTSTVSWGIELPGDGVSAGDAVLRTGGTERYRVLANGSGTGGFESVVRNSGFVVQGDNAGGGGGPQRLFTGGMFGNIVAVGDPSGNFGGYTSLFSVTQFRDAFGTPLNILFDSAGDTFVPGTATEVNVSLAGIAADAVTGWQFTIHGGAGPQFSLQDSSSDFLQYKLHTDPGTAPLGNFSLIYPAAAQEYFRYEPFLNEDTGDVYSRALVGVWDTANPPIATLHLRADQEPTGLFLDQEGAGNPFIAFGSRDLTTQGWRITHESSTTDNLVFQTVANAFHSGVVFHSGGGVSLLAQTSNTGGTNSRTTAVFAGNTGQTANLTDWKGADGSTVVGSMDIGGLFDATAFSVAGTPGASGTVTAGGHTMTWTNGVLTSFV